MTSRPVAKVIVKTKLDLTGGGRHAGAPTSDTVLYDRSVYVLCIQ